MERSTALGAAGGVTLAIAGAATALVMTVGGLASADPSPDQPAPAAVVTEYVDQYGNPVADPATGSRAGVAPVIEIVDAATGEQVPTVVTVPSDPTPPANAYSAADEYEEGEDEYEEDEEHEDEYEEGDYEEDEHEEGHEEEDGTYPEGEEEDEDDD